MKVVRILCIAVLASAALASQAAGIQQATGSVNAVRVQHWNPNIACVSVGSRWFKLDLTTKTGIASYALSLSAFAQSKPLLAAWNEDLPLEGGCDVGTTMYPLYSLQLAPT